MHAMQRMQRHGLPFNVLACIHRRNAEHPLQVYRFLRESGVSHIQFDPVVCYIGDSKHGRDTSSGSLESLVTPESVLPDQFGRFLIEVFDEWIHHDVGRIQVGDFDQALAAWLGRGPSVCVYQPICGRTLSLEHNGDLFVCEQYVDHQHKLGNIHETTIADMFGSDRQQQFALAKAALPGSCQNCEVRFACNGGCQKNRLLRDPNGEWGMNFLCAGYRNFFDHIAPVMSAVAEAVRAGRPVATVIRQVQATHQASQ